MKIVFASNNQGKINEMENLLKNFSFTIIPQALLKVPEIEETGLSFIENAILKARHAAQFTGLPAIADDSGLIVDALKGAPGIFSARYAGAHASSALNIKKLLKELNNLPDAKRTAAFHCALVYLNHANDPMPLICEGTWLGKITTSPQGANGFGYDPVFYDFQHQCSAAQIPLALKNTISHRGQALQLLIKKLAEKIC